MKSKKYAILIFLILYVVIIISSLAIAAEDNANKLTLEEIPICKELKIVTFKYPKNIFGRNTDAKDAIDNIIDSLLNYTKNSKFNVVEERPKAVSFLLPLIPISEVKSRILAKRGTAETINIRYERMRWRGTTYGDRMFEDINSFMDFSIPYATSEQEDYYLFQFACPSSAVFQNNSGLPLYNRKDFIIQDFLEIFNYINTMVVKQKISGEFATNYPAESVFANFKRLVKDFVAKKDKLEGSYWTNIGGKSQLITVEIFPYRSGSKVVYKIIGRESKDHFVEVLSNGTVKGDISNVEKEIIKIAND